jgi:hypothetical protein
LNKSITGPCALLRFIKVSTLLLKETQTSWLATQSARSMFLFPSRAQIRARVPEGGHICISKQKLHPCHCFDAICRKPPTSVRSVPLLVPLKRGKTINRISGYDCPSVVTWCSHNTGLRI